MKTPAKTAEQRAAERIAIDYPVKVLSPPTSKRVIRPAGKKP